MSKLEDIVPTLELCEQIPAGEFEDSALVWDIHGKFDKWHVEKRVNRSVRFGEYGVMSPPHADIPAPTLAEILAELPPGKTGLSTVQTLDHKYAGCRLDTSNDIREFEDASRNPATAALRLWFKVRGRNNE